MLQILKTYTTTELKQIISRYNKSLETIRGYSKLKKDELLTLMTKAENINKFKSVKAKVKSTPTPATPATPAPKTTPAPAPKTTPAPAPPKPTTKATPLKEEKTKITTTPKPSKFLMKRLIGKSDEDKKLTLETLKKVLNLIKKINNKYTTTDRTEIYTEDSPYIKKSYYGENLSIRTVKDYKDFEDWDNDIKKLVKNNVIKSKLNVDDVRRYLAIAYENPEDKEQVNIYLKNIPDTINTILHLKYPIKYDLPTEIRGMKHFDYTDKQKKDVKIIRDQGFRLTYNVRRLKRKELQNSYKI